MNDPLKLRAQRARAEIESGALRGRPLLELLLSVPPRERDGWADKLLGFTEVPPDVPGLPRGAVPYLPCGVEAIVAMVLEVPLRSDDAFVDLGSGLGRVAILAHLLSGAASSGIELQEPLVCGARARCAALFLSSVTFVCANAAETELEGSVFFLYSPFNGELLQSVLRRLEQLARRRPIVVCAVDLEFHDVPWLQPRQTACVSLTLYDSHLTGVARRCAAD